VSGLYQPANRSAHHRREKTSPLTAFCAWAAFVSAGLLSCAGPRATAGAVGVVVAVDGREVRAAVPSGSSVVQAVEHAGIELGELDRLEPPAYTLVTDGTRIEVTRLKETFEVEQVTLPFLQQTIRNEALPEGEARLLQAGENGLQEITYRIVTEEGIEVSRTPVKSEIVQEPKPEILMIGALAAFSPVPVEGTLAFVSAGNVWTISGDSGRRNPITVTGDAGGRILQFSPRADWLAFTRSDPQAEDEINSLWAVSSITSSPEPISLGAANVVHFADWSPNREDLTVAYSTVEPRPAAPGWQANNDLNLVSIRADGSRMRAGARRTLVPFNSGGAYGWWGTSFAWSSNGDRLAYARPDGVGVIEVDDPAPTPVLDMTPYQTLGDWAWVPGVTWGWDDRTLFTVRHAAPVGLETEAASPGFDLVAVQPTTGEALLLHDQSGMFAEPVVSPARLLRNGEVDYQIAFLQAMAPLESESSRYRLVVVDRDGSNLRTLFPAEGEPGLEPHQVAWSPDGERLGVIYQGDLWIVDVASGQSHRLTSDGQVTAIDWAGG